MSDTSAASTNAHHLTTPNTVVSTSKAAARIRVAAAEAFAENGYGGTTTRDIAARLGLSPAAMYPHYKSKEELLFAISYEGHLKCVELLTEADEPGAAPAARLVSVVSAFTSWQATHHIRGMVVQYELTALSPEHYREILTLRREISRIIERIIREGARDGSFVVPDVAGVNLAINSLCVDVCRWFPGGGFTDPDAVADLYAELALRLVGATR
ncbi:Transcriptional regulator [Rhodococcus sp. RD6.2]|uniref:TetR/AcrR family transcriptional regulator n=1 Tax=Rhodococcus sp. RD6.2 TaxID=260936 RepID=UPI00063B2292|nr:TetR/AcrR family transcriptional regulator [Rhodococcus sp. RD6.2]CRK49919.1 Transcriptional regulator [Rhodococcus sp. RD6.2]